MKLLFLILDDTQMNEEREKMMDKNDNSGMLKSQNFFLEIVAWSFLFTFETC